MPLKAWALVALLMAAGSADGARRALLVGINDYTASRLAPIPGATKPERDWPNLSGAVNDVAVMREMLLLRRDFEPRDIVVLTNQSATRTAILRALHEHLVVPAAKDDVILFYFAGHGSQVFNSRSDEPDRMDESRVPADSRRGARDIRDKELRILFNRILDRGARLTVIFDSCHSASGARGLTSGTRTRGIAPDPRDVHDGSDAVPKPEARGALVLSAAEDFTDAHERRAEDGLIHGAFTWTLVNALRHANSDEPAEETFLRARARLRASTPVQEPVMAGNDDARLAPLFGTRALQRDSRPAIVAGRHLGNDTVAIAGGWAHGLNPGTELRSGATRLVVTAIHGLGRGEARVVAGPPIEAGTKLEVARWMPPPARRLRVWMPHVDADVTATARDFYAKAKRRGLRWIDDPTEVTPQWLLRHTGRHWQFVGPKRGVHSIANIPRGASLFVQFPAPRLDVDGVEVTGRPEEADYILTGRYANARLQYAWIRPSATSSDARLAALPARTKWTRSTAALRDALERLRRIHAWQQLESRPSPYRLVIRHDGAPVTDGTLVAGSDYTVGIQASARALPPRYVYVFVIDSAGEAILVFPTHGSVENRLTAPRDLARFAVEPPYGLDTWFLLTTDEPLANPWLLEWEGVRTGRLLPSEWEIEKVVFESVRSVRR